MITLQPVAMGPYAADFGVYAPSNLRPVKHITYAEFIERYADGAMAVSVSLDGVSEPQTVTAYGRGLDCWYIVR